MILLIISQLAAAMAINSAGPLKTVESVDINRYAGKWYEIASFPQRFQKGCHCTFAEYTVTDKGYVKVFNSCRKDSVNGKLSSITGKAFPVKGSNNSKLKVQFFWPFKGNYWIIELDENYSYAVVGDPSRNYLWILCRTKTMDDSTYQMLLQRITEKGFDVSRLKKTIQSCPD